MFKCFLRPPFGSTACGANLVVFYYGLKLATRCASSGASGASWKGFLCRLSSMLSVTGLGLSDRSYKETHGWSVPVLDLEVLGRGHTANRSWLSSVLDLEQSSKKPREP